MHPEERRRRPRFSVSWPIRVVHGEEELARGETENVSRTGAYFRSNVPSALQAGMTVSVRITIPDSENAEGARETLDSKARVVRLDEADSGCGIALHFTEEMDVLGRR